jgi:hypothetical protein
MPTSIDIPPLTRQQIEEMLGFKPIPSRPEPEPTDEDDIVFKLRNATPCAVCSQVTNEAADLIETLRGPASKHADQPSLMASLESAIVHNDPCGRCDCVGVSSDFLRQIRDELVATKKVEVLARRVVIAARKLWRDGSNGSNAMLMSAVRDFMKEVQ